MNTFFNVCSKKNDITQFQVKVDEKCMHDL